MKEPLFEIKQPKVPDVSEERMPPEKVGDFFSQYREFLEWYAGDTSLQVRSSEGIMTADGPLETFAIDLEKGVLYGHPKFFEEKFGYSESKALFAFLHEIEHFRELKSLLREKGGGTIWRKHQQKIKGKRRYHILDNCFDDVKMNRSVVTRVPTLTETRQKLYQENLFPESDLTALPKHLQFAYVLNCENQEVGTEWTVHPEVREAMQKLQAMKGKSGVSFLEYASHPNTPMSIRLRLQEAIIEPIYEKFFEEDVKEKKKQGEKKEGENGEGGESQPNEASDGDGNVDKPEGGEVVDDNLTNPEEYFQGDYDDFFQEHQHATPEDMIDREVEKEIEKSEAKAEENVSDGTGEQAREAYARAQGVTAQELREYQSFLEQVESIENPETGEKVIEELREIFKKIITRRKKKILAPQYPLPEGDLLAYPAEAFARARRGEREPDVWEDIEIREKTEKLFGDFDVTIVGDVSGSMKDGSGEKYLAQRESIALIMEALAEFAEDLDDERATLYQDLHIRTEAWVFGDTAECIKGLSEELSEKERVSMYNRLGNPNGNSTRDFLALQEIVNGLTEEEIEKMQSKKLKKIVIVMTDGMSDDASLVQSALTDLREKGVIVIGIGVTVAGQSALTTYAPEARLCENTSDLASIIGELLKEHLNDL